METSMNLSKLIRIVLALALMTFPALAGTTFNGTVTYREKMALPPDARLRVTLVDLPGGLPQVGATASIPAIGGVPIAFSLNVNSDLDAGGTYGLMAEISSAGRVLFRNVQPVPVDATDAGPVHILVHYAPGPAPFSADPPPAAPPDLLDAIWTVTSIGGRPIRGTRDLTLTIAADLRAGGSGGCNNYFTETTIEGDAIAFGPAAATRMACAPEFMAQEAEYFAALAAVAAFELDSGSLRLLDAAGVPLVGLVRNRE